MNRSSMLFLLIFFTMAAIGVYEALNPLDVNVAFARFFGLDAFILLCVSLMIGPLVTINHKEFAHLVEPRRAIGIAAFVLVIGHIFLSAFADYDFQIGDMITKFPLQLSIPAAFIMMILTLISSDYAVRKLGGKLWKGIQRLNYLVFVLSFSHFILEIRGLMAPNPSVNLAEAFAILLGISVIVLQLWGFSIRKAKEKEMKAKLTSANPQQAEQPK